MNKVNYERMDAINSYIQNNPECKKGIYPHLIKDKIEEKEVYELPLRLLRPNESNGRIFTEKIALEKKLGFKLESSNKNHLEYFIKMLLPNEEDTRELEMKMSKTGQAFPGLITADGILLNANRRFAAKYKLKQETILVSILSATIDEREKYDIEFGLQVKSDSKKEYTGINRLFMIKRGIVSGKSEEDMKKCFEVTSSEIKEALGVIKLIDSFLEEFNREGDYEAISDMLEHFKDFYKELSKIDRVNGDEFEIIEAFYKLMSLNLDKTNVVAHRDIRDTMYYASVDPKIKEILTRNMFIEDGKEEDILTDLSIAKGLAKTRKDNDSISKTIKKIISQIDGVNVLDAEYETDEVGSQEIINKLEQLMITTENFVEDVKNELSQRIKTI